MDMPGEEIMRQEDTQLRCPTCGTVEIEISDDRAKPNRITDYTWKCLKCNGFGWVGEEGEIKSVKKNFTDDMTLEQDMTFVNLSPHNRDLIIIHKLVRIEQMLEKRN